MRRLTMPACLLALAGTSVGEVATGDDTLFGGVEVLIVACAALLLGTLATAGVAAWAVLGQGIGGALGAIAIAPGALTVAATLGAAVALHHLRGGAAPAASPTGEPPRIAMPTSEVLRAHGLTPRECEVAELALWGFTAEAIGRRLFIGRRTVETHLSHVYSKLGVHSRAELVETVFAAGQAAQPAPGGDGPGTSPRARSRSAVSGGPRWNP
jgi:DNA-binding CsgD family transcriptional regulator